MNSENQKPAPHPPTPAAEGAEKELSAEELEKAAGGVYDPAVFQKKKSPFEQD